MCIARTLTVIWLGTLASATSAEPCVHTPLVVTNATLWTPLGTRRNQELIASDGKIAAIGRSGTLSRPPKARFIDAGGNTLLPGLIDAHTHLFELPGDVPSELWNEPRTELFPITTRQLLRSGVTTARVHLFDLTDGPALKRQADDDCFPAPRLQFGGPAFIGGTPEQDKQQWGAGDAADIRAKIDSIKATGASWVSLHDLNDFKAGQLDVIVEAARGRGLRILAGAMSIAEIQRALDIGADTIEYLVRSPAEPYPPALIQRMQADRNLALVPIIGYDHRIVTLFRDPSMLEDRSLIEFMPASTATLVMSDIRRQLEDPARRARVEERLDPMSRQFRQLIDAQLNVITGTDAGSLGQFHVDAIWWELETWRRLGVPAQTALAGATSRAAEALRDSAIGGLEPGKRADFILYSGSPDDGPFELRRVQLVAKGGIVFVENGRWVGH